MKTRTIVWLSIGIVVGGLVAFVVGVVGILEYSFHNSDLYQMSLKRVTSEKQVIAVIGQPLQPKFFISGNLNTNTSNGHATGQGDLYYDVAGPKGKCEVYVTGEKDGVWRFKRLEVHLPDRDNNLVLENTENEK